MLDFLVSKIRNDNNKKTEPHTKQHKPHNSFYLGCLYIYKSSTCSIALKH